MFINRSTFDIHGRRTGNQMLLYGILRLQVLGVCHTHLRCEYFIRHTTACLEEVLVRALREAMSDV